MARYDKLIELLDNLTDDEKMEVWNTYCEEYGYSDEVIHHMSDLDGDYNLFSGMSALDILTSVRDDYYGLDPDDEYYCEDDYCSFNDVYDSPIDNDKLAQCIIDNKDALGNDEISEFLGKYSPEKIERVVEILEGLDTSYLVSAHNEYAKMTGGDIIRAMTSFDVAMEKYKPFEIATKLYNGSFYPNDSYFWLDFKGNLSSATYKEKLPIDVNEMAEYAVMNDVSYGIEAIRLSA